MSKPWTPDADQLEALEFGVSRAAAGLILDPGFGKTSISLAIISLCLQAGDVHRVLVVAPIRVCQTVWPVEAEKWSDFDHLNVYDITEWDDANRTKVLLDKSIQVVCINPDSLKLVLNHPRFAEFGFDMLVVDESTKFKDSTTQRFKHLKKQLYRFKRRLILTGTMVPNGLQDLFGQVYILDNGDALGAYITHFRMNYMYSLPNQPYTYEMRPGTEPVVYGKVKDLLLRMKAKNEPELKKVFREVDLPKKWIDTYRELDQKYITVVNEQGIVAPNAASAGMKCRQFANGFVYRTEPDKEKTLATGKPQFIRHVERIHDEKIKELIQLVDEMNGRPLLVAYEFQEDAEAIKRAFPDVIDLGQVSDSAKVVESFNRGEIPLLMGHPQSIGHGLNLQEACNAVCFFTPIWDLELYEQFYRRVFRRGQKAPIVFVYHIVCRNTRDMKVAKALESKEVSQAEFDAALVSNL